MNINHMSGLPSGKYHKQKRLLFSSSRSRVKPLALWPNPPALQIRLSHRANPRAGEFPGSQMRRCLVWEHCAPVQVELQCSPEHRRHLWGEAREGKEASFWGFRTTALCRRARYLCPELLTYFYQTIMEQSTLIIHGAWFSVYP